MKPILTRRGIGQMFLFLNKPCFRVEEDNRTTVWERYNMVQSMTTRFFSCKTVIEEEGSYVCQATAMTTVEQNIADTCTVLLLLSEPNVPI